MTDEDFARAARPLAGRYIKKQGVVEAVKWDGSTLAIEALNGALGLDPVTLADDDKVKVPTAIGAKLAAVGDYVIKNPDGSFCACGGDLFERTYVRADGGSEQARR